MQCDSGEPCLEAVERGEPLTGESLSKKYLELARTYYGHAQGITRVDDIIGAEWAYIRTSISISTCTSTPPA